VLLLGVSVNDAPNQFARLNRKKDAPLMPGHMFDTYSPPAIDFEWGEGAWLYARGGERYLDFIAGIAVNALGHAHPALREALNEQAGKIWHLSNMFRCPGQQEYAEELCTHTFADRVFFTNSGTEAVECAIKTARRYHYGKGNPERVNVIAFEGSFHGRTYGAVNAGANPAYREGFGPSMPGFMHLPFGDHEALKAAMDETTAAVIVEPVQGEGGVRALPPQCLTGLRALCDERGALLIYDEVQCGAGRTGKLYAYQWAKDGAPDIMAVAKGIGGGFPVGACLATENAAQFMKPGTHGSTFGGNPLAMAVGRAVLAEMTRPGFLSHVEQMSSALQQGMARLKDSHPDKIEDIRGKGLLLGMKLKVPNMQVRDSARDKGMLVGVAGHNVLRLAPPLIIDHEHVARAMDCLDEALSEVNVPA
jgi:acetylornithine/N-succinyldiaminopimelate aminotransferase